MKRWLASASLLTLCVTSILAAPAAELQPPRNGKVEIFKSADVKPGMKAVAWTVFAGSEPEAVPIEIIGLWKNAWGSVQITFINVCHLI